MASELDRAVQTALKDLIDGKYPSIRAAVTAYFLYPLTLSNRARESLNRRESYLNQQILSSEQENKLI
jgi:hypothetical protein